MSSTEDLHHVRRQPINLTPINSTQISRLNVTAQQMSIMKVLYPDQLLNEQISLLQEDQDEPPHDHTSQP